MFLSSGSRKNSGHTWQNDWLLDLARNRPSFTPPSVDPPGSPSSFHSNGDSAHASPESESGEWSDEPDDLSDTHSEPSQGDGAGSQAQKRSSGPSGASGRHLPQSLGRRRNNKRPIPRKRVRTTQTTGGGSKGETGDSSLVAALQLDLQNALDELEDARELTKHLTDTNDDMQAQRLLLLTQIEDTNQGKDFQIECLREQLDQAHFKLRKAERRNRYVDDTDRWKADAKYKKRRKVQETTNSIFGFPSYEPDEHKEDILKERRGAQGLVAKSVTVVTAMMSRFNEELFQTSASISDLVEDMGFERASMLSISRERAERVLGTRLVSMILPTVPKSRDGALLNSLLVQVATQTFLAYWCNSIIEAWYPKQETFAEFLVDLSSKLKVGTNRNVCGRKTIITQKHTRDSTNLFNEWVNDILEDFKTVLSIFGWRIPRSELQSTSTSSTYSCILSVVKEAYDLRTAMAEVSTSGDVDLVIVSCDTPYNALWMDDAYDNYGRRAPSVKTGMDAHGKTVIESVVATTGIGLQRETWRTDGVSGLVSREIDVVLKPRVVLEYTLLEAMI